jgi:phage-related protein
LGGGIWEVRTDLLTSRTARVLICASYQHLVALHGFIKKSRATPKNEMEIARARRRELER